MDWEEIIENLKYLISDGCTDTQFDYADEIEFAIRVMEGNDFVERARIDKAIEEIKRKPLIAIRNRVAVYKDGEEVRNEDLEILKEI